MIYVTGANGLVGSRLCACLGDYDVTKISYRDEVPDVFESHEKSFLIHLGWSSTTRAKDKSVQKDVINSKKLFELYQKKNRNGHIIFLSSAGDLHRDTDNDIPTPHSLYGKCKLDVENILNELDVQTTILRVTNILGGVVDRKRVNGLVDKLLTLLDTDEVVEIYANLRTTVDIIHVDDVVDLIIKSILGVFKGQHETFLVGAQSITLYDIIDRVSMRGTLNLKLNQKAEKSNLNIDTSKVREIYNWEPKHYLQ